MEAVAALPPCPEILHLIGAFGGGLMDHSGLRLAIVEFGPTAEQVDVDSLANRHCKEEATTTKLTAFSPRWVSAWVWMPLQ
jgi:hypothetical protein